MTVDVFRDLWQPDFEVRETLLMGKAWPVVFVDKFEVNERGERRYVKSRAFDFNTDAAFEPLSTTTQEKP